MADNYSFESQADGIIFIVQQIKKLPLHDQLTVAMHIMLIIFKNGGVSKEAALSTLSDAWDQIPNTEI